MAPKHYKSDIKTPEMGTLHLHIPAELTPGVNPDQIAEHASEQAWNLHEQEVVSRLGQSALPDWTERPLDVRPEHKPF